MSRYRARPPEMRVRRAPSWDRQVPLLGPVAAAAVAVGAGLLLDLAFPGVGWWPLAPVALAAFLVAVHGRRVGAASVLGLLFGLAFFVPHVAWSGIYVGALPWLALATLEALYFAVFGGAVALASRCSRRGAVTVLVVAGLWVAQEALRSRTPFGGFPWGRLAFSQADAPSLGLAALGGAPAVSFVVALSGAALAHGVLVILEGAAGRGRRRLVVRSAAAAAVVAVASMAVGLAVPRTTSSDRSVTVAAVQGNVPRSGLDFNAERRAVLDNHARATLELADAVAAGSVPAPDLVVWPENASDIDPLRNPDAAAVIDRATDAVGVPILLGAVLREPADLLSNVSMVWQPGTGPGERYVKRRPVPFAEYMPFRAFFRLITDKVDLVATDFAAGQGSNVVTAGPVRAGVAICFEVAFDDHLREAVLDGADVLVVQTNNATFGRTDESVQQLAMSRVRAVELGRSVVHISTVGVSALIRPDGSQAQVSGHFTQETLVQELPVRQDLTLAARVGAWPELLFSLVGGLGVLVGASARRGGAWGRPRARG